MAVSLKPELVLLRTKAGTLANVIKLNLWGNDLEDISLLRQMPNLEIVSLSVNKISTLRDFQCCYKLKELYLRKNLISDASELEYVAKLPELSVLWLLENPIAERWNYRDIVISLLPNLDKLDDTPVSVEEKSGISEEQVVEPRVAEALVVSFQTPASELPPAPPERSAGVQRRIPPIAKPVYQARNDNILSAVLMLMKELNSTEIQLVIREGERRLQEHS